MTFWNYQSAIASADCFDRYYRTIGFLHNRPNPNVYSAVILQISCLVVTMPTDRDKTTYHWDEKASCGGIPYLMMALRNALRCRVLKPSTCTSKYMYTASLDTWPCGVDIAKFSKFLGVRTCQINGFYRRLARTMKLSRRTLERSQIWHTHWTKKQQLIEWIE